MKKIVHIVLKVIFCLILVTPVLGATGVFPPPTPDLYNTPEAFTFISMLMAAKFTLLLLAPICLAAIALILMKRTGLAMLLILPVTVNVVAFHALFDGGLLTSGASLGLIMLAINAYFLWVHRAEYKPLWNR